KEGIKNAIASDNDFMAWCFISDTMIHGHDTVTAGISKTVTLKMPVKAVKKVFLNQVTPSEKGSALYFEHKFILPDKLIIISAGDEDSLGKTIELAWIIYADAESERGEAWREYLQKAKESLINGEFQDAIIEAEIAVEVTLEAIVWELLTKRKGLSPDVADWILNNIKGVSDRSKRVMELAIGKKISDINPIVYKSWVNDVAKKRNGIVHHGEQPSKEEAVKAIGAAFEIIWLLLELVNRKPVQFTKVSPT
ncbi:MAG TPA: hypothetical protein VE439_02525, partial [Anaerolineae bacterium]|nr:hypothetical protein [Anaerolineae bacterium]